MVSLRHACFRELGTAPARESIQSRRKKVGQRKHPRHGFALKQSLHHPAES